MAQPMDLEIGKSYGVRGPKSDLEKNLIEEYLEGKGYRLDTLSNLPEGEAKALMAEACRYASLKLAEIESRSHLRETIHRNAR